MNNWSKISTALYLNLVFCSIAPIYGQTNETKNENHSRQAVPQTPQSSAETPENSAGLPRIFLDAKQSYFDKEGNTQIFKGNVVAIAAKILVSADNVILDKEKQTFTAQGHVLLVNDTQILSGNSLVYEIATQEFTLTDAILMANDTELPQQALNKILGFNKRDLEFAVAKKQRLGEISKEKIELQKLYREQIESSKTEDNDIVNRYIILLEKDEYIRTQHKPSFSSLSAEQKDSLQRRQDFWNASRTILQESPTALKNIGYFMVEGDEIKSLSEDRFEASRAFITPCYCQAEETPAWGFQVEHIEAQSRAYADLYHPVLHIKGIPIFYLPYLKVPVKSTRQSGFLFPKLSHNSSNGTMYSQPIYFAFNEKSDATIYTDFIEKRGLRLGLEYRIKQKEYSGWTFNLESIRDKLWLEQKNSREKLSERYSKGLIQALDRVQNNPDWKKGLPSGHPDQYSISDPYWWLANNKAYCLEENLSPYCINLDINRFLNLPINSWRGQFDWKGQAIIAPRLSFISQGKILSDHRYQEDLWIQSYTAESQLEKLAPLFTASRAQFHLDGEDFYIGLGSHFADPILSLQRFSGYQVPVRFKFQPRTFSILKGITPHPIYGNLTLEQRRIEVFEESKLDQTLATQDTALQRLGNGTWRKATLKFNTPAITDQFFQANYFLDFEYREVKSDRFHQVAHNLSEEAQNTPFPSESNHSFFQTATAGIDFHLPLDGFMEIQRHSPAEEKFDEDNQSLVIEHRMDWNISFSVRPYVNRIGNYGSSFEDLRFNSTDKSWEGSRKLTYYPSDQNLVPHRTVSFSTNHSWSTYEQQWSSIAGKDNIKQETKFSKTKSKAERLREQAKNELFYSLDEPIHGSQNLFQDSVWLSNRYRLVQKNHLNPMNLKSEISYDFIKEAKRIEEKKANKESAKNSSLTEAWTPLKSLASMNWSNWHLNIDSEYNLYNKTITKLDFHLGPPEFFGFGIGLAYLINKSVSYSDGSFSSSLTKTRSISLSSSHIPHTTTSLSYGVRIQENAEPEDSASLSLYYLSPAQCWGLKFSWIKSYDIEDWSQGDYYLGLVVNFLGFDRNFGNLAQKAMKEEEPNP